MKFAILHTIAILMVALTIIPQISVAPTHDKQDITQILESVKFIDEYTNTFTSAKHSDDRDKQKVYKLSITELREKIMAAHPEYKDNEHTLAGTIGVFDKNVFNKHQSNYTFISLL